MQVVDDSDILQEQINAYDNDRNTRRANMIGRYFKDSEITRFFPINEWPAWAKDSLLSRHRNNRARYELWYWLYRNGAPPDTRRLAVLVQRINGHFLKKYPYQLLESQWMADIRTSRATHVDQMDAQAQAGIFDDPNNLSARTRWYDIATGKMLKVLPDGSVGPFFKGY